MKTVQDYISVSKLSPDNCPNEFEKEGRGYFYIHNGGRTCVFHNGASMRYIGYVEFPPFRSRGNHYHYKKHENICIISGSVMARFLLPDFPEDVYELSLSAGDILHIEPGCAHSLLSETGAVAVEYSPEKYERSDTVRFSFKWEKEAR